MPEDALNAICPYFTMYPLRFPLSLLRRHGKEGEWVLDPFCGRGTTNFAARLLRMPSLGVDSSPVAAALSQAKLAYARPQQVVTSARSILSGHTEAREVPGGEFWELAYHPETLREICRLREGLLHDCRSASRVLLRAVLLGALHGPRPKRKDSYLSNQSPRTFAPKPRYAVRFWTKRGLRPERVDVLTIIEERAKRYLDLRPPDTEGAVRLADSRERSALAGLPTVRWIITSPPYYGMRTYLADQWLRSWFLGGPSEVEYRQPPTQLEHTGAGHFIGELARVWTNLLNVSDRKTRMIVRFGGIHDRDADPVELMRRSLRQGGWRLLTIRCIPDADNGRRQAHQFQSAAKKCIAEHDYYCEAA